MLKDEAKTHGKHSKRIKWTEWRRERPTEFVDIEDDDDGIGIGITCKMLFTLAMFILQYDDDDSHECSHLW